MDKLTFTKIAHSVFILFSIIGTDTGSALSAENTPGINSETPYRLEENEVKITADPVVVGAGDIALCSMVESAYTAALIGNIDGDVLTFGDNTQLDGTAEEFVHCYGPTWGQYKDRTHPTPGNHDYHTTDAIAYFDYFGPAAGEVGKGYYSFDIGNWHLIALNSEIDTSLNSPQVQWLNSDLLHHRNDCILAYWHRPLFTSAQDNSLLSLGVIWDTLYRYGVDVVLNGNSHMYERFAPQNPEGVADPNGIRQFVVGTGGGAYFDDYSPIQNSEVANNQTYGVIKLTLHQYSYDWEFIPIEGQIFSDSGSTVCSLNTFESSKLFLSLIIKN
jgi:hypothetical protein